jgi:DnaB-like helicase N terminal domain/AAA domain
MSAAYVPPQNLEAEEDVLGAILLSEQALEAAAEEVEPSDFYGLSNGRIFEAALALHASGVRVDALTLAAELERLGLLEKVGGAARIQALAALVPPVTQVRQYARLVKQKARQREVVRELGPLVEEARNGGVDAEKVSTALEAVRGLFTAPEDHSLAVLTARELCALPDPPDSDTLLGPLLIRGHRLVIGGHTGEGKTTLALQAVRAVVHGEEFLDWKGPGGCRALVIDAEQGLKSIKRALREAGLTGSDLVDYVRVPDGLSLDTNPGDIAKVERLLEQGGYSVVVLDPLYKLHSGDSNAEREAVDLMRRLDGWRERYGFALILPVHLRKPPVGAKFSMHEFFGSSAYLRGAEVVIGLQRVSDGYSRLHIFKDRDGDLPVGQAWELLFDKERGFRRRREPEGGEPNIVKDIEEYLADLPCAPQSHIEQRVNVRDQAVVIALKTNEQFERVTECRSTPRHHSNAKCWALARELLPDAGRRREETP